LYPTGLPGEGSPYLLLKTGRLAAVSRRSSPNRICGQSHQARRIAQQRGYSGDSAALPRESPQIAVAMFNNGSALKNSTPANRMISQQIKR
jgi:hypothetical protein